MLRVYSCRVFEKGLASLTAVSFKPCGFFQSVILEIDIFQAYTQRYQVDFWTPNFNVHSVAKV